jgi:hypothetical protein
MMIYTAEMTYRFNNPSASSAQTPYWPANGTVSDINTINSNLGLSLQENYYDISVSHAANGFSASAGRIGGTRMFTVSQTGEVQKTDVLPVGGGGS